MSQPELEEAYLLLRKAREDANAVRKFCADPDLADAVVGFHAQQATEKALKAVLAAFGDDFPWTHDYARLLEHGIGLTDVCKRRSGSDQIMRHDDFDVARVVSLVAQYRVQARTVERGGWPARRSRQIPADDREERYAATARSSGLVRAARRGIASAT